MNIDHIISSQPISVIWKALGGDPPKRGRARAFYREGDNPQAVSLNDAKGCWHDFVTGEGGGVLDLVQRVRSCDRADALRWVANLSGLQLDNRPLTPAQRREYGRRCAQAEQLALDVADFEHGLEVFLQRRQDTAAAVTGWLLNQGVDDPAELLVAASRDLAMLRQVDADSLVKTYCEVGAVRRSFREAGRKDREHAQMITRAIVGMLAQAEQLAERCA